LDPIELTDEHAGTGRTGDDNPYGSGGLDCNGILHTSVTSFASDGSVHGYSPLSGGTMAVDASRSPDGRWLAIAVAGLFDPLPVGMFTGEDPTSVIVLDATVTLDPEICSAPAFRGGGVHLSEGQAVSVAFDAEGKIVLQTREPSSLVIYRNAGDGCWQCAEPIRIPLGGAPRRDTGHDLFHHDAGGGLACASCHPGGKDDGHTWEFVGLGPRRTQQFVMGLKGTEPLHWDAEFDAFEDLMAEVFVRRMGGPTLDDERGSAMADWIETLRPLPAPRLPGEAAVQRGKAIFESETVGCATCHGGPKLTNNVTVDVGTGGGALQVPSLVGLAYRQPFMHNGCAKTLRERFDPDCGGGDAHGTTSHLSEAQIDDLVAYLESL
jgi:mono/diheme cytochrome c family protein